MSQEDRIFDARLAEYTSARDEMIGAINNQHMALTFGTATLVGVVVAGLTNWQSSVCPALLFAIPLISAWILAMWTGEVVRMLRSAQFCGEVARAINGTLENPDPPALNWETWRREVSRRNIHWTYLSVGVTMYVTSIAAVAGAVTRALTLHWTKWLPAALTSMDIALGIVLGWWLLRTLTYWQQTGVALPSREFVLFNKLPRP